VDLLRGAAKARAPDPVPPHWRRFVVLAGFSAGLSVCLVLGVPELFGLLLPETDASRVALPPPCPSPAAAASVVVLRDEALGLAVTMPRGEWEPVPPPGAASASAVWHDRGTGDQVSVALEPHFPGRPRIEHGRMHGISQLRRCRERVGTDSAWIASGFQMAYGDYGVAIALIPVGDGRWLYVRARTQDGASRQRLLLAAVRTASLQAAAPGRLVP